MRSVANQLYFNWNAMNNVWLSVVETYFLEFNSCSRKLRLLLSIKLLFYFSNARTENKRATSQVSKTCEVLAKNTIKISNLQANFINVFIPLKHQLFYKYLLSFLLFLLMDFPTDLFE